MELISGGHPNFYLLFEICGAIAFAVILGREIYQKNKLRIFELFSCLGFGMIIEIGNTYLAHTYHYGESFLIQLFNVPIVIGFGWACIIYCVMLLSDQYRIPWALRPFMDALTALILDLAVDPIAIRLGFWNWSIAYNEEWYGVPFENLIGWFVVVFSFSLVIRYLRTLNFERITSKILLIISPIITYIIYAAGLILFSLIAIFPYTVNNWKILLNFNYRPDFGILYIDQVQFWKLIVFVVMMISLFEIVAWSIIKYRKKLTWHFDALSFSILSGLHLFFFAALIITGIYKEMPILAFLSAGMFLTHCLIHFLPYLITKTKIVYFFKKLKRVVKIEEHKIVRTAEKLTQ